MKAENIMTELVQGEETRQITTQYLIPLILEGKVTKSIRRHGTVEPKRASSGSGKAAVCKKPAEDSRLAIGRKTDVKPVDPAVYLPDPGDRPGDPTTIKWPMAWSIVITVGLRAS